MTLLEMFPEMPRDIRAKAGLIVNRHFQAVGFKEETIPINKKEVTFKAKIYREEDLPGIVALVAQNFKI